MHGVMMVWLFCSIAFTMLASSTNGIAGFFGGLGVSLVFLPFMVALGAVVAS